ncbi:MAG: hypothetical protein SFY56_11560 [Bacteroidota bacterium]|nr:hypothetical protein [Bacteroidota bacterium]
MINLNWVKTTKSFLLKNEDTILVNLNYNVGKKSSFYIDENEYTIDLVGFWIPEYVVLKGNRKIISLKQSFWENKGEIIFNDTYCFTSEYKNKNGLSLVISEGDNHVLSYKIKFEGTTRTVVLEMGTNLIDVDKILLLATLGFVMINSALSDESSSGDILLLIS